MLVKNRISLTDVRQLLLPAKRSLAYHQSTKGSWLAVTAGGNSFESGISSKFETSFSSFTLGLYGEGVSNFSRLPKSSEENHLCFKMSSAPSFKLPYRLLRSA